MNFRHIVTLFAAAMLSLAALLLLDHGSNRAVSGEASATTPEESFGDRAVAFRHPDPLPTAEPPESEARPNTLMQSIGGGDPVPVPADDEGNPVIEEADFFDLAESAVIDEVPVEDVLEAPSPSIAEVKTETDADPSSGTASPTIGDETFAEALASATRAAPVTQPAAEGEPASIIEETPNGFWLREARLNDVFQHLAQLGNHQYFHNTELAGPNYVVTGQLMDDDPVTQMEELALMYGITIHRKGNTVYALTNSQLSQLPTEPFRYQLKYLRPADIEQIKLILQPFLTPGSGIIEYETKTNTLIVMDNERKLDALALFLSQIDQPKQQIAIETRILRVTSSSKNRIGVDWSSVLGDQGVQFNSFTSLNALFNLPELDTVTRVLTATGSGNSLQMVENNQQFASSTTRNKFNNEANLVLSPVQLSAVLRALNSGGLAQQESSPTLIAEDNEEGLISIIDRIPIITATISETTAGQNISETVRYSIDESDPVGDPATTREIGVSVSVTPTILPDDTIRMALRPRSAQVVDFVQGQTGNLYPRVNESTVTTTARVPNGHSLLIGGFYEEVQSDITNKVPVLGDIPAVKLLFKSTEKMKEHTSLVFIVTPKLYRPHVPMENDLTSHEIHESHVLPFSHDYPDPRRPGHNYRSDLRNTANNSFRRYEPDPPSNLLHPAHPYNLPQSQPVHGKYDGAEPSFATTPSVTVRPVNENRRNGGLLGRMFQGNQNRSRSDR